MKKELVYKRPLYLSTNIPITGINVNKPSVIASSSAIHFIKQSLIKKAGTVVWLASLCRRVVKIMKMPCSKPGNVLRSGTLIITLQAHLKYIMSLIPGQIKPARSLHCPRATIMWGIIKPFLTNKAPVFVGPLGHKAFISPLFLVCVVFLNRIMRTPW